MKGKWNVIKWGIMNSSEGCIYMKLIEKKKTCGEWCFIGRNGYKGKWKDYFKE